MRTDTPTLLRWTARVLGALIVLFWGWFLLADLFGDQGTTRPLVPGDYGILATLLLSLAGLVVAWKRELAGGTRLHSITRHLVGAFHGVPGARAFRRYLAEVCTRPGAGTETLREALRTVEPRPAAAMAA